MIAAIHRVKIKRKIKILIQAALEKTLKKMMMIQAAKVRKRLVAVPKRTVMTMLSLAVVMTRNLATLTLAPPNPVAVVTMTINQVQMTKVKTQRKHKKRP